MSQAPLCVWIIQTSLCVFVYVCVYVCVCVLLGMIERVSRQCQGCGYSPARGRGRGAQILHYGLIHHPWDSLAPLSVPLLLPLPPSNLVPPLLSTYSCTGPSLSISSTSFTSSPSLGAPLRLLLFFPLVRCFLLALLLACFAPVFPLSHLTYIF